MSEPKQFIRGYEILNTIGKGGFGRVLHAYQRVVTREVAIKVIDERYSNDVNFIRRFENEAQMIARLEHPHIVSLYDYWRDPSGAYLVMPFYQGGSLRDALIKQRRWSLSELMQILDQLANALTFAHTQGVVHRDIKPENIMLDTMGNVFLADFGIAIDLLHGDDIEEKLRYGSPAYLAPEQVVKKEVSPSADIYGIGILLFELLTGKIPFTGKTTAVLLEQTIHSPLPSVLSIRPDLPPQIDQVLWRATAKTPRARYDNIRQMTEVFRQIISQGKNTIPAPTPFASKHASTQILDFSQLNLDVDINATGDLNPSIPVSGETANIIDFNTPSGGDTTDFGTLIFPAGGETGDLGLLSQPVNSTTGQLSNVTPINRTAPLPQIKLSPYVGLRAFEETDSTRFFGRDDTIQKLLARLRQDGVQGRFLAVVGASGSGKSSVVQAGLLPQLRAGMIPDSSNWLIVSLTPGSHPLETLTEKLYSIAPRPIPNLQDRLAQDKTTLQTIVQSELSLGDDELLLFIDQFEELFTQSSDESARKSFLDNLYEAVTANDSRVRVMLTLRADFYDRPLAYAPFSELLQENTYTLLPMNPTQISRAIEQPASLNNISIDADLIALLISDMSGQAGALPLLQYTLNELYEQGADANLTVDIYEQIGGIAGALAQRADTIMQRLSDAQKEATRRLFLRLIHVNDNGSHTRQRILWQDVMPIGADNSDMQTIIDVFGTYRLLTFDRDATTRTPTIEITHESMLEQWTQLRKWIDSNQIALAQRDRLDFALNEWERNNHDVSFLAQGGRLLQFEELATDPVLLLTPDETSYITSSQKRRTQLQQRSQIFIGVLILISIFAVTAAIFAFIRERDANLAEQNALFARDQANFEANRAQSRALAAVSLADTINSHQSLLLSAQAYITHDTYEARHSLLTTIQDHATIDQYLHAHTDQVRVIALAPSQSWFVSAGRDGLIQQWDMDGNPLQTIATANSWVNALDIAPNEQTIAIGGQGERVTIYSIHDTSEPFIFDAHDDFVWAVRYHPNGEQMASADGSGRVHIWDVSSGDISHTLTHNNSIYALQFSADGNQLYTGGAEGIIRAWDTNTGELLIESARLHDDWIFTLDLQPALNQIVSGGTDNRLVFTDINTLVAQTSIANAHNDWIRQVRYNDNGRVLMSVGADSQVRLWRTDTGELLTTLPLHHTDAIWAGLFLDATRLVTGGDDASLILWDLSNISPLVNERVSVDVPILNMVMNPDTNQLVFTTSDANNTSTGDLIWFDLSEQMVRATSSQHQGQITVITQSHDGQWIASGGIDQTVQLSNWNGEIINGIRVGDAPIQALSFTPNDEMLYIGDDLSRLYAWTITETGINQSWDTAQNGIMSLMSLNNNMLAIGGRDGSLIIWDTTLQDIHLRIDAHNNAITTLIPTQDNRLISGSRDGDVRVWDWQTGEQLAQMNAHMDWVMALTLDSTEQVLATSGRDGDIRLWDMTTYNALGNPLTLHQNWVTSLRTRLNTNEIISAGRDGQIITWDLDPMNWVTHACTIGNRTLTTLERNQYDLMDDRLICE